MKAFNTKHKPKISVIIPTYNEEANIDDVVITTDTVPPAVPQNLVASDGDEQITLQWNDNTDEDLWGYNIYSSNNTGGPYTKINSSPVINSQYTDSPLYGGGTYYYVVTAVDAGTNESDNSTEANATASDIPPAVPTGLVATPLATESLFPI